MLSTFFTSHDKSIMFNTIELNKPTTFADTCGVIAFLRYDASNQFHLNRIEESETIYSAFQKLYPQYKSRTTHVGIFHTTTLDEATAIVAGILDQIKITGG